MTSTFAREYKRTAAVVDRLTFRAHIIETGTQSYRLSASRARAKPTRPRDRDREEVPLPPH